MATAATKTKTGANEGEVKDPGQGGSQVQTMHDAGDYDPADKVVRETASDVKEHAPDGTDEGGAQLNSVVFDDKSYPQTGEGGAKLAKNKRAIAAVLSIAERDPVAAAKLIRAVDGDVGGPGGDKGATVGGEPDAVTDGLESESGEGGAAAPPPPAAPAAAAPPAVSQDDMTRSKLQENVTQREQQADVDKQVLTELKTVLDDVTAFRQKRAEDDKKKKAKEKAEKEEKEKKEKEARRRTAATQADERAEPKVTQGDGKVPHASVDPEDHPQTDGDPDKTGAKQMAEASSPTGEGHAGQAFSESADRDYKHAVKTLEDKLAKAKEAVADRVAALTNPPKGKTAMRLDKALEVVSMTELGQVVAKASSELRAMKAKIAADNGSNKDSSGNIPPDQQKANQADDTVRYDKEERGDDAKDDISVGTDERLESPETAGTVDEARGNLDKKHNEDTAGSTVAVKLSAKRKDQITAEVTSLDKTAGILEKLGKEAATALITIAGKQAAEESVKRSVTALRTTAKKLGDLAAKEALTQSEQWQVGRLVSEGRMAIAGAKSSAMLIKAQSLEGERHRTRFARISPSFKLAIKMVQADMIKLEELPNQVADFMRQTPAQFDVAEKMAMKVASRAPARPSRQEFPFPSRFVSANRDSALPTAPSDGLDGIFDDE